MVHEDAKNEGATKDCAAMPCSAGSLHFAAVPGACKEQMKPCGPGISATAACASLDACATLAAAYNIRMATSVQPQVTFERLMQFAWGYAPPLVIEAACRHKLFDHLDGPAKTASQLAAAAGVPERGVRIVANALVGIGLLAKDADGMYTLTPESAQFLVSTKPSYMGRFFHHTGVQIIPRWMQLGEVLEHGGPKSGVNQHDAGAGFFHEFVEDLFPLGYPAAQALAAGLQMAEAKGPVSVLDLAAGSGVWSIAMAQASPHVRVTAVDWPEILEITRRVAERCGVAERFTFTAGDLATADFGAGHQVATLGHILHSEGEARSKELLAKTSAALAPGGTIAIQEFLVDRERAKSTMGLIFAVNMLVMTEQGDTFSFEEIAGWLEEAGFKNPRTLESPGPSPLILATKE
jgi:ubiquinone/menaquinone biosynthesis C-methylase UbiE